jgi:integrase
VYGFSYRVRIPGELLGRRGAREDFQRRTREDAEKIAEDRYLALKKHGTSFAELPPEGQKQTVIGWGRVKEYGLDFLDVIDAGLKALRPAGGVKKLSEVFTELRASKKARLADKSLDERTEYDFRNRSLKIEQSFGEKPVGEITAECLSQWLQKIRSEGLDGKGPLSQRSVLNYRNVMAEALSHAEAKRYLASNPFNNLSREEYKALGGEKSTRNTDGIGVLTVANAEKVLRQAFAAPEAGVLPSLVLRLFCGLRTAEVCRIDWKEVRWLEAKPYVHIPAGKAKKRRIRHVDIPENALAWLKLCNPPAEGPVAPCKGRVRDYCRLVTSVTKKAGVKMNNNDTRHSFGSYHFALHGDSIRTAVQMGHKTGDAELFDHYRTLVRREEAEAYFSLRPTTEAAKVTQFPQAATA